MWADATCGPRPASSPSCSRSPPDLAPVPAIHDLPQTLQHNPRSYWTPTACDRLGYVPLQDAEDYAAEILARPDPLDPVARRYQGGAFAAHDLTAAPR